eukprot:gnl/MRDRNA2_/MRDRNA2_103957_c0_seq1.p1 gnl/MRDRNA2_/MRDRNA2_103957_c0~~gnl/MRDRNA2_/MRDRNA2_103957_c0_seq1.p1  ORF type:complete len:119 (-),score=26.90 gnl/MRDRNA2_/MRDRNA2_103957_c0_seq1:36-392(-)
MQLHRLWLRRVLRFSPNQTSCGQSRYFTNWWQKYVDGINPDRPDQVKVAAFLRAQGVDPYRMPRDRLEEMRKFYNTEYVYYAKKEDEMERSDEACELLKEKKALLLTKWTKEFPLNAS